MTNPPDSLSESSLPIQLVRALAVLDTESTGLNPATARIVRISVLIVQPDGSQTQRSELVNPGVPIPPGAAAVHGITDDDVRDAPPFQAYARGLENALEGCDLAGFAIERFHLPLLIAEFRRAGIEFDMDDRAVIDTMSIYHRLEPRDFNAAYRQYVDDAELSDRSEGKRASEAFSILIGQLRSEPDLPLEPHALGRWGRGVPDTAVDEEGRFTYLESGEVALSFGKYSGETLEKVIENDADYLAWIASNESFGSDTRRIARDALIDAQQDQQEV